MKKILWLLLLAINSMILHAQNLSISGKVSDPEKGPVQDATVYLLKEKDSSIINYTSTNKEGKFSLKTDALNEPSILRVHHDKFSGYSQKIEKISKSLSLGEIELTSNKVQNIEEIKITVSPVKIKKDTIEFNAAALKVRPDSKIEELLKQIPGVEIDNDGKITVSGKEVDQVMINGKPFFDKDGKIALKNLPADIIKNIQFTTTKTKEEEFTGKAPKSNNTTINFNIDEKKNKGLISRLSLGYGSDKRYEGSAFISYFKKDTRINLIASSNNINSQGFSTNEVFDSMGRGRSSTRGSSSGGGIQKSTTIGINYNDKLAKDIDLDNLSITHSNSDSETGSKVSRTTLLPEYVLNTQSESKGENKSEQYNFDTSAKITLDSLTTIYLSPKFSNSRNSGISSSNSSTSRDNSLLNESSSYTSSESESNSFTPNIYFLKQFRKKKRYLSATINTTISESTTSNLNKSETVFYEDNNQYDNRNQLAETKNQNNNYYFGMGYSEPVSDSASVSLNITYNSKISRDLREVNDFNAASGIYSDYNILLSNSMNQKFNEINPTLSFDMTKKKFSLWTYMNVSISDMKVHSIYNGQAYSLQKNFTLPGYNVNLNYELAENKRIGLSNSSNFSVPGASQLIPYEDTTNPLSSHTGNPDLKNTWISSSSLYFSSHNRVKEMSYRLNVGFTYRNNDIVNYSRYDDSGKQLITYDNISGNKNASATGDFSKSFKWKDNKLTINPRFNIQYNYNKGFINGQLFSSSSYSMSPGLNITYNIKDKLSIQPSYRLSYNSSKYSNYSISKANTTNQTLKLELTNYVFDSRLVFGNDFEYSTNSNITPGFKKDFYFWNTSLGYSFFDKQFTAKVKIYDVLNQNQSVKRTISNAYIEDREDLILKRYIMFSLSMKLNKFAGKKK